MRPARPTLGAAVGLFIVAAGLTIGLRSMSDNSFLTHLATGRLILEGGVPSADPYTFTAPREPWVVQSWLASWLYASAESIGGADAIRLLMGAVAAGLASIAWSLTRAADGVLGRLALGGVFIGVASGVWSERPFMFGLLALGVFALAAEGRIDSRWLVPVGYLWVSTHGSFPLGIVYLAVTAVGTRLDARAWGIERRCLLWGVIGIAAGGVGPVGPRILVFPVELLGRSELLSKVIEWQAPAFTSLSQRVFLLQIVLAVILLARRPSYRSSFVVAVFVAAALLGSRNVSVASLVLLPAMARSVEGVGSMRSAERTDFARALGAVGLALLALLATVRSRDPAFELASYPVDALAFLEHHGVDTRQQHLAAPDIVGNFIGFVYGADERVFYDDRFDMFPEGVSEAHISLVEATSDLHTQLAKHDVQLVVAAVDSAATRVLTLEPRWRVVFLDERWVLSCRRGADLGGGLGTC